MSKKLEGAEMQVFAGGLAVAVAFVMAVLLRDIDVAQRDVFTALTAPAKLGMGTLAIWVPPTGVGAGYQLGLTIFLFASVPAGISAAVLRAAAWARRRPWTGRWDDLFRAGFVFHVSTLTSSVFLLMLLVWAAFDTSPSFAESQEIAWWARALLVSVLCSAWALRCWRLLHLEADAAHTGLRTFPR